MTARPREIKILSPDRILLATVPTYRRAPEGSLVETTSAAIIKQRRGRRVTEDLLVHSRDGVEEFIRLRHDGKVKFDVPNDWLCEQVKAAAVGGYDEVVLPRRFIAR